MSSRRFSPNTDVIKIDTVNIEPKDMAGILSKFIHYGSKKYRVDKTDIKIFVSRGLTAPVSGWDFATLWREGNKFFDILYALADPTILSGTVAEWPGPKPAPLTSSALCEALFSQYFYLLTRANYALTEDKIIGSGIPKFLKEVMGYAKSGKEYAEDLCTFDLRKIDPSWIEGVPFGDMGKEANLRLGLGVAGYRVFSPFKFLTPKQNMNNEEKRAHGIAKKIAESPLSWDIHPCTRNPAILTTYGPLNASLNDLASRVFEQKHLEDLKREKVIFEVPVQSAKALQWKTWNTDYIPNTNRNIF